LIHFLLAFWTFNDLFVIFCQTVQPNRAKLGMDDMERQLKKRICRNQMAPIGFRKSKKRTLMIITFGKIRVH
jgi:hypothetical protein